MTQDAILLRARDLLWCIALSDVDGRPANRESILKELQSLETKCRLRGVDLYPAAVASMIRSQRHKL